MRKMTLAAVALGVVASVGTAGAQEILAVVNIGDWTPRLTLGTIGAVFGQNLAASECTAQTLPLPNELCGVQVTVRDIDGNAVPGLSVELEALGGDLGGGFRARPASGSGITNVQGVAEISGVPQGPCEVTVREGDSEVGGFGPEGGCFLNQAGELLKLEVDADVVPDNGVGNEDA